MNTIDFKDFVDHPILAALGFIAFVVLGTLGIGPVRAIRARAIKTQEAGTADATSSIAKIRAGDNTIDQYRIIAERAQSKLDEEFELRRKAVTEAAQLVSEAQKEAAKVSAEAILSIRRVEDDARASIRKADDERNAAVQRADAAEKEVKELTKKVDELTAELHETKTRLDELLDRGSFKASDSMVEAHRNR